MVDPSLRPSDRYKGIKPVSFDDGGANPKTFRDYCEEMAIICLQRHNQDKVSSFSFLSCSFHLSTSKSESFYVFDWLKRIPTWSLLKW